MPQRIVRIAASGDADQSSRLRGVLGVIVFSLTLYTMVASAPSVGAETNTLTPRLATSSNAILKAARKTVFEANQLLISRNSYSR